VLKFRKRPIVVEAAQFLPGEGKPLPEGVHCHGKDDCGNPYYSVKTAHGQRAQVVAGDWIIVEPGGRGHYPCKPDIFAATYEPAEEGS
jgi:hypothetical protein